MESVNDAIIYSKKILENVFTFHKIYNQHLIDREHQDIFFPTSDDLLPKMPINITEELNSLIKDISDKWELLNKSQQFQAVYKEHYNENEDLLDWTFGKNGIEQLLPISVYIFIKKCKLKCGNFENAFDNLCNNFSIELINQLFNSNKGNSIMIWKTITLILILNKPNQDISAEEINAITYQETENQLIKLSKGLYFDEKMGNNRIWSIVLNTNNVRPFLISPVLLEAYCTVLSEIKTPDTEDKKKLEERIKQEINDFLDKDTIYFSYNMHQHGLTLADGSVLINYEKRKKIAYAACCLMTIFHEMTHVLFRKIIYTNTFRRSFDETQDSGRKVEELLVGDLNECHQKGCYFILKIENYQYNDLKTFNLLFKSEENKCVKQDGINKTMTYILYKKTKKKASCVMSL